jgi:phosphoglycolate phosphatase-like HAD superfamily hydrolase
MIQLTEEIARRGGQPREALEYKRRYHDLLWKQVGERVAAVKSGAIPAEEMTVPGARRLLESLTERGVQLYLASGTDLSYVRDELQTLGLAEFFGSRVYGALDDYKKFSKAMIVAQMIEETGVSGRELAGFGDGFVEIEEVKRVGGLAVGVASNEETREGVNDWKRHRLLRAGADWIIGDYRRLEELTVLLGW